MLNGTFLGQAGTESNFQSPESAPLPMQFTGQALTLQEERVKVTNPVLSQSGPSQQSAAGSQTFDLSSGQKVLYVKQSVFSLYKVPCILMFVILNAN